MDELVSWLKVPAMRNRVDILAAAAGRLGFGLHVACAGGELTGSVLS